jgi:hypothetical protein
MLNTQNKGPAEAGPSFRIWRLYGSVSTQNQQEIYDAARPSATWQNSLPLQAGFDRKSASGRKSPREPNAGAFLRLRDLCDDV